jgi:hypothetical protein
MKIEVPRSINCLSCSKPVQFLGAFVKISQTTYMHVGCFREDAKKLAIQEHEAEKSRKEIERREREQAAALERARRDWDGLPRCARCGIHMGDPMGETFTTHSPSGTTRGVCAPCVASEARARSATRLAGLPEPPRLYQQPPEPPKAPKTEDPKPRDRFALLDLDE